MAKLSRLTQLAVCIALCLTSYLGLLCRVQVLLSDSQAPLPRAAYLSVQGKRVESPALAATETATAGSGQDHAGRKDLGHTHRGGPGDTGRKGLGHTDRDGPGDTGRKGLGHTDRDGPGDTGRKGLGHTDRDGPGHTGRDTTEVSAQSDSALGPQPARHSSEILSVLQRQVHASHPEQPVAGLHRAVRFVQVGDAYVYGAFLDLRQAAEPTIRLLVLRHRDLRHSLVCRVDTEAGHHTLFSQAYRMCENHGKPFEGWIYSCRLPGSLQAWPGMVTVVPWSQSGQAGQDSVTLRLTAIPAQDVAAGRNSIAVCVPPLFGDLSLAAIVNFLQMCKVLGADRLFLYLASVTSEIRKFLAYHSRNDPSLSVVDWQMPEEVTQSADQIWYHGQLLAVQDCLYTNMASFAFLLFLDLDEMLVPRLTTRWPDMFKEIFAHENRDRDSIAALSFKSAFFDPTRMPEDSGTIPYFQHVHRTCFSQARNKLAVQPLKVFELGIHHLSKGLSQQFGSVNITERTAAIHHYRACVPAYETDTRCLQTVEDRAMLRYKDALSHLSHRVITDAFKLFA